MRWLLVGSVAGLVLVGAVGWSAVRFFLASDQSEGQVLSINQSNVLVDMEGDNELGRSRREQRENGWYVFSSVRLPEPAAGEPYHSWLEDAATGERRYMGAMFPVQDEEWSVTYTTQEDVRRFTEVLVSLETTDQPVAPEEVVTRWEFR